MRQGVIATNTLSDLAGPVRSAAFAALPAARALPAASLLRSGAFAPLAADAAPSPRRSKPPAAKTAVVTRSRVFMVIPRSAETSALRIRTVARRDMSPGRSVGTKRGRSPRKYLAPRRIGPPVRRQAAAVAVRIWI